LAGSVPRRRIAVSHICSGGTPKINDGSTSIVDHVVTFDAATSRSYELFFSCETRCYEANREAINEIVDSLTVED